MLRGKHVCAHLYAWQHLLGDKRLSLRVRSSSTRLSRFCLRRLSPKRPWWSCRRAAACPEHTSVLAREPQAQVRERCALCFHPRRSLIDRSTHPPAFPLRRSALSKGTKRKTQSTAWPSVFLFGGAETATTARWLAFVAAVLITAPSAVVRRLATCEDRTAACRTCPQG